jgi:hypothetical protein
MRKKIMENTKRKPEKVKNEKKKRKGFGCPEITVRDKIRKQMSVSVKPSITRLTYFETFSFSFTRPRQER